MILVCPFKYMYLSTVIYIPVKTVTCDTCYTRILGDFYSNKTLVILHGCIE